MKRVIGFIAFLILALQISAFAGYVNGYTRSNGTYVHGYNRSDSDSTVTNNYSYAGNTNPYTGAVGHNYYRHSPSSQYYDGSNN